MGRRLTDVDNGGARDVLSGDLGHHAPPARRLPRRGPPAWPSPLSTVSREARLRVRAEPASGRQPTAVAQTDRVVVSSTSSLLCPPRETSSPGDKATSLSRS